MTELERLARAIAPVAWEPSRYFNSATRRWNRQNSLIAAQAALAHWTPKRIATMTNPTPSAEARAGGSGMTEDDIKAIDAQIAKQGYLGGPAVLALTATLREAWEDNETLLREHNHALAVIRDAS